MAFLAVIPCAVGVEKGAACLVALDWGLWGHAMGGLDYNVNDTQKPPHDPIATGTTHVDDGGGELKYIWLFVFFVLEFVCWGILCWFITYNARMGAEARQSF